MYYSVSCLCYVTLKANPSGPNPIGPAYGQTNKRGCQRIAQSVTVIQSTSRFNFQNEWLSVYQWNESFTNQPKIRNVEDERPCKALFESFTNQPKIRSVEDERPCKALFESFTNQPKIRSVEDERPCKVLFESLQTNQR